MCVAEAAELQAWRQAFGLTAQATDGSRNRQQEGIVAHGGRMREPTTDPVESRESVCPEDFLQVRWSSTVMWCCRSRLLSVSVLCAAERHGGRQESSGWFGLLSARTSRKVLQARGHGARGRAPRKARTTLACDKCFPALAEPERAATRALPRRAPERCSGRSPAN